MGPKQVPLQLLADMYSILAPTADFSKKPTSAASSSSDEQFTGRTGTMTTGSANVNGSITEGGRGDGWRGEGGRDVDTQINTLVRVGLLERSSSESVRFVAKYMETVIYDMILHSKRKDMHKVG